MMDKYFEAGGNCLDTARVYAEWLPDGKGASERTVGEWIRSRKQRDRVLISTKGGHPPVERMEEGRLSRECLESDLDESLKAIGTDYIDIYWLHRDDLKLPVEEIMENLQHFINKGKIKTIGCSNWKAERIEKANQYALAQSLTPFAASQIQWSLAVSTAELHQDPTLVCMDDEEYQWYVKNEMPIMAYSSQAKGFFARGAKDLHSINQKAYTRFLTSDNIARLQRVKEYATRTGLTPTAVALGYILSNKLPSMAVIGCKNIDQLKDSLTAKDVELSQETVEWLYNEL